MPHLGWNRGRGVLAILWSLLLALALLPATASADRPFAPRFAANTQGDITIAANGLLSCVTNEPICPAARNGTATPISAANNNARVMTYVDVDGDPATFDSSEASLAMPTGARVLFAGLYYGARLNSTISAAEAIVRARDPAHRNLLGFDADLVGDSVAIPDELPPGLTPLGPPAGCEVAGQIVTCRADSLGSSAEASFDIRARAEASVAEQTLTNSATVSSASPDGDGSNDLARLDVPIGPAPPQSPPQSPPSSPGASPQSVDLAPAPSGATSPRRAATTTLTAGRCASSRG